MPPTLTDGEGQQKNSRKIKRLRDASCMRKRETKQDRWGRQRGGRKARWDKLDRQPSALKSRLRLVNSAAAGQGIDHDARLDAVEEAFAFVDAASVSATVAAEAGVSIPSATPAGSSGGGDGNGGDAHTEGNPVAAAVFLNGFATGAADADDGSVNSRESDGVNDAAVDAGVDGGVHPPSPNRIARQQRTELPPTTPTTAATVRDGGGNAEDTVSGTAAVATPPASSTAAMSTTPSSSSTGIRSSNHSSVGSNSGSSRAKAGGGGGRRSSLRSPGGLSRAGSMGGGGGGGLGSGSYRGSPPPLHRRLSSPAGVGSSKKGQKQRQAGAATAAGGRAGAARVGSGLGSAMKKKQVSRNSAAHEKDVEEAEVEAATPPPPPSLFESVFKDKLPSLTPRKAPPATPRLSRDSIVHAIFQSLFGKRKVRSGPRERYGGDWDDVDGDDEEEGDGEEEEVDESWIKSGINLTLFNSKAVDFACRSTAGADLLHQYVDSNAVFRLVTDLRFEDPRVPSPRLMIIKAVYENCAHLRLPTLRALAHASHDHLMRTRELEGWAARAGVDIAEAAAAAVADGTAKKHGGGGGELGEVGGGRVRVTGRDQSQTLGELLLFVLETFPKFFLGMVPPDEAGGQQQVMEQGGLEVAFNGGGDGYEVGGEVSVPPAVDSSTGVSGHNNHDDWNEGEPSLPVVYEQGVEVEQQQLTASTNEGSPPPNNRTFDPSPDPSFDASLDAAALEAEQCRSPTPTPYQPPTSPAAMPMATVLQPPELMSPYQVRNSNDSESCSLSVSMPENEAPVTYRGDNASAAAADGGDHPSGSSGYDNGGDADNADPFGNDGGSSGGEGEFVRSPEVGDPGGGGATADSAVSTGGDPVLVSDCCAPAWPSLPMSSPSPAKQPQSGGAGDKQEPPWSPAWATAGVRILEDNPSEEMEGGREMGEVVNGGCCGGGGCGDGAWGQGMASKDLVWGSSGTTAEQRKTGGGGDMPATPDASAGAARALRFTTQGEGDGAAAAAAVEDDAASNGVVGDPFSVGRDLSQEAPNAAAAVDTTGEQPLGVGGGLEAGGLGFDEWPTAEESKSSTPEKRPTTLEAVEAVRDAEVLSTAGTEVVIGGQEAVAQPPQPPLPATPTATTGYVTASAAAGVSGVPMLEIDLPSAALKEATRSLCNLYASHGAPAAGAEAAAAADAPERLQPLAVAGSTLCSLWPPASTVLLRRLLGTWPAGSARREVAYLRLIAGVACAAPPLGVVCPGSRIPIMLFRRLAKCINSSNTKVAQEAAFLVQADFILMVYLAPDRRLMDLVTNALCANREHWSADVRNASDQTFDLMLDFL